MVCLGIGKIGVRFLNVTLTPRGEGGGRGGGQGWG